MSIAAQPITESSTTPQVTTNTLDGIILYRDDSRPITVTEKQYRDTNRIEDADMLKVVSSEPGTTWLVGPNNNDSTAQKDIQEVARTSSEASSEGTTPVYQLYAIPNRDACAEYSKGGFNSTDEYMNWIDRILSASSTEAIFLVEADAIANIAAKDCLTQAQTQEREQLLKLTVEKLRQSSKAAAIYIDAAHSEWFPNTADLVGPLSRSGIESADGIFVNTSFFVKTEDISNWSKKLLDELGNNKKVIIDTSRNGNGVAPATITGDARWCNPEGRAIGLLPTTQTGIDHVDAFLWIKNIGESDGSCNGNPAAGIFVPDLALKLVQNRQ
ncbi:MAG: glycoside hydrolase family 6 protein [Patescibacteria group bacterium]